MKVLFVGGGKRVELAQMFKRRGHIVDAYENTTYVPIASEAREVILGLEWSDRGVCQDIINLSSHYDLVLPLHDNALEVLSKFVATMETFDKQSRPPNYNSFLGKLCLSAPSGILIACDKENLANYCYNEDWYPAPKFFREVILKPRKGFSSRGISVKKHWLGFTPNGYVAQRYIAGGKEYSVDCYYDKAQRLVDWVPRRRLEVVGGEVTKSITVQQNTKIETILKKFRVGFRGPITFQVIEDDHGDFHLMEINARFGGGATLSIAAGFDMIALLDAEYGKGESVASYKSEWKPMMLLTRSYRDTVIDMEAVKV